MHQSNQIKITHAHLHNLKGVDISIPKNKIVAITGVSGSGKSTLAFDLIFQEGRRRYLQSIGMLPDLAEETGCESITGLGPAVAVQQGIIRQSNPRSTVGTRSGIFSVLRMLYVYEGKHYCPGCGLPKRVNEPCSHCGSPGLGINSGYFSFNSTLGMCFGCEGRGYGFPLNMDKLLPQPDTTLRQLLGNAGSESTFQHLLNGMYKEYADLPFNGIPDNLQRQFLYGIPVGHGRLSHNLFEHLRWKLLKGREVNDSIARQICPQCEGYRLGAEALEVTLAGYHIGQLSQMSLSELNSVLRKQVSLVIESDLGKNQLKELFRRLTTLEANGLSHLTLYRELPSLSGGELQRLFLASHLHAKLDSLIYVLDEPTIGLHELEKDRLIAQLEALRDQGNSVLLVEHDQRMISIADWVIDMGPFAGQQGGEVIYQGNYSGLLSEPASVTGQTLTGYIAYPAEMTAHNRSDLSENHSLRLREVCTNNLQDVNVDIPLGGIVGVAGVSGSGKSSLVIKTLIPLLEKHFTSPVNMADDFIETDSFLLKGHLEGVESIDGFSAVTQQPIGRHDNSNPATYLKIWDVVRKLFASTPEAKAAGLKSSEFSFNASGACPTCSGSGKQRMWLGGAFFATQQCPECKGRRFHAQVMQYRYRGKTILDILEMPVSEAFHFFNDQPRIRCVLDVLNRSGMGYLPLGQPAPTLSGGESQRLKLAKALSRVREKNRLYIFDEPTIGLSSYDTGFLLKLMGELVLNGHSVLLIEHDPRVLSRCDWIIELGPGGGAQGGQVIAEGAPETVCSNPFSRIATFLERVL
jgi:excinuclease ABC A subunit